MPIYEYQCDSCQDVIEKWQSLSDKPISTCPSCSGAMKKLISRSSFQLKGGGWYADGYSGTTSSAAKSCPEASCASAPAAATPCSEASCAPACPAKTDTPCACS